MFNVEATVPRWHPVNLLFILTTFSRVAPLRRMLDALRKVIFSKHMRKNLYEPKITSRFRV